jgi:hypothetical protein
MRRQDTVTVEKRGIEVNSKITRRNPFSIVTFYIILLTIGHRGLNSRQDGKNAAFSSA